MTAIHTSGIKEESAAGRPQFERLVEARRTAPSDEAEVRAIRRGWRFGSVEFKAGLLGRMEEKLGEPHAGKLKREGAEARAERVIREELTRSRWTENDLKEKPKSDPAKLALAARLRQETNLTLRRVAARLRLGR
jgi:hypothetical protein